MTRTIVTANRDYTVETDEVIVAESARPFVEAWARSHGYIQVSEAPTANVHSMLTRSPAPFVPDTSDRDEAGR